MHKWNIVKEDQVFRGRVFSLKNLHCSHHDKTGEHDFFVLETFSWVNIVSRTPEGKYILVKQHRLGTNEITIESVGGVIEDDEDPGISASRELLEETGYRAGEMIFIKKLAVNPAIMNNYVYFYFAKDCVPESAQNLDPAEDIEILSLTPDEVTGMIRSGEINHSIVITAFSLYFLSKHFDGNMKY